MVTLDRSHCAARRAWNSPALDLERQERRGHGGARESQVWFTISHGILNEIYAGRLDTACIRDFGFIVTGSDKEYFSEEKRDTRQTIEMIEDGVPAFRLVNSSTDGRYRITRSCSPIRCVRSCCNEIHFEALAGTVADYRLHAIVAPHLVNAGADNTGWCGNFKGTPMLCARAGVTRSRWPARCRGLNARSAMSGFPMPGRRCRAAKDCAVNTSARRTATLRWLATIDLLADGGRAVLTIGFGASPKRPACARCSACNDRNRPRSSFTVARLAAKAGRLLPLDESARAKD